MEVNESKGWHMGNGEERDAGFQVTDIIIIIDLLYIIFLFHNYSIILT